MSAIGVEAVTIRVPSIAVITHYIFECENGKRGRRAYKDVSEAPSVAEVERVRKNARCAQCGSTGLISLFWDNGWTDEMTVRQKAHIDKTGAA